MIPRNYSKYRLTLFPLYLHLNKTMVLRSECICASALNNLVACCLFRYSGSSNCQIKLALSHELMHAGVMSLHMNPHNANLLAVGCYNGSVAVFDVRDRHNAPPIFSSTPKSGCHARPVWAVEWLSDQSGAAHAFHSLSSDGRLLLWTLATAELTCQVCSPGASLIPVLTECTSHLSPHAYLS